MFILTSLQRPDKNNLDPNIKNLFNLKVIFRANNVASSKVAVDDESAFNLPNRQALFIGTNQKTLRTPYIDDKIIAGLLKNKYEKDHKYVEIFPKEQPKQESNVVPIGETTKPKKSKGVIKKC
jgi:hypothetical protein